MTSPKKRRVLYKGGKRGDMVKAVIDQSSKAVIVYYRDFDRIERKKFFAMSRDGQREAVAWAEAYLSERTRLETARNAPQAAPITHRELWRAYEASPAFESLRMKTKVNYRWRWGKWELFRKAETPVDETTLHHVDLFIAGQKEIGTATNQARSIINVARIVYNWGQSRDLVRTNKLALYRWKQPKDAVVVTPGEYSDAEYQALLEQFDPSHPRAWRPWVALMLVGHHGMRANAVLHLRWSDIDFGRNRIVWPAEWQKQGKPVEQPIGWATYSALLVAFDRWTRAFGSASGPASDWVLFALNDKTKAYSYTSLHYQLHEAEKRAGVRHQSFRALHGFRRMVVGEIGERSGDRMLGLEYVGDTDPKMLKSYDKRAQGRIDHAASVLNERPVATIEEDSE